MRSIGELSTVSKNWLMRHKCGKLQDKDNVTMCEAIKDKYLWEGQLQPIVTNTGLHVFHDKEFKSFIKSMIL